MNYALHFNAGMGHRPALQNRAPRPRTTPLTVNLLLTILTWMPRGDESAD